MDQRKKEELLSAGIDIGTSTTKLIISRFSLMNTAGSTHMPRIEIVDKEVVYKSPIFRTPLKSDNEIDMNAIEEMVLSQYNEANITSNDIKTGAVIITGETATKTNAQEMINHLSRHAGEFLVATAGPDLESIIAAKGSGAYDYSKNTNKTIANIDIGGGTANIAVYQYGKLLGTCTLHVGGKLIEVSDDKINYIAPSLKKAIKRIDISIKEGEKYDQKDLRKITDYMTTIISSMLRNELTETEDLLLGRLPNWEQPIDVIMFSGGVSECIYHSENCHSVDRYNDIGNLLAMSITEDATLASWEWIKPNETVRATVLGAGTQTTEISGGTIQVDNETLPLRNLPVYKIPFKGDFAENLSQLTQSIEAGIEIYDPKKEGQNFALYLSDLPLLGFKEMQSLADALVNAVRKKPKQQPLIIVLERDLAKSLGQTIRVQHEHQHTLCIDQIYVEHGDYLDIGKALQSGVVPVVIKTLTFH
ncbi:ethanolamine ammonia-lyase reactivating factor EutA [Virgibacillus necropolis]|uniref:Ethanolamine utilization protein n=1 Tax=Virgibacillus necropolis TaxID=163877 RepID=A0A221M9N9_9BACI|nr:ethanolamine ammonia-lyase reactivating factor EutA [Virgibacillus necropolis]ASN04339.1 ethanolamine utilization protein [Virgibacillus necropolis]